MPGGAFEMSPTPPTSRTVHGVAANISPGTIPDMITYDLLVCNAALHPGVVNLCRWREHIEVVCSLRASVFDCNCLTAVSPSYECECASFKISIAFEALLSSVNRPRISSIQ